MHHTACDCHLEIHAVLCVEKWLAAKRSHFLVITLGNLDHLFLYATGNRRDQKSDLALQASCPGGPKKVRGRVSLTPFLSLAFVSLYTSRYAHSHRVDSNGVDTHKPVCCMPRQADREEKVADDTFGADDCSTM